ncbi:hypothetical protein Tco_0008339 [Tanacetum coccineum]
MTTTDIVRLSTVCIEHSTKYTQRRLAYASTMPTPTDEEEKMRNSELSSLQRQPSLKFMLQKDSITENAAPATTKYPKDHPTHNAQTTLQHLPLSPGINPCIPGRLVAGDTNPGRHVARHKLQGKARRGFFPGRHSPSTQSGPHSFSQRVKCHGGGFSRATCRPGLCCY